MAIRFYTYISDTKVDMLFAQLPPKVSKRISAELTLDIKVLSVALRQQTSPDTRYGKLKVVTEYLRRNQLLGTLERSVGYFEGSDPTLSVRDSDAAYWLVRRGNTVLAMTGSGRHLIGGMTPSTRSIAEPPTVEVFGADGRPDPHPSRPLETYLGARDLAGGAVLGEDGDVVRVVGRLAAFLIEQPPEFLEYMAVRQLDLELAPGSFDDWVNVDGFFPEDASLDRRAAQLMDGVDRLVLASPLYVALADPSS